jgi:hypothetical protein
LPGYKTPDYIFFHPDYTVGSGFTPDLPGLFVQQPARGLIGLRRITAGGDLHPAPKTALFIFLLYYSLWLGACQAYCRNLSASLAIIVCFYPKILSFMGKKLFKQQYLIRR